jgi:hypothetical protein
MRDRAGAIETEGVPAQMRKMAYLGVGVLGVAVLHSPNRSF